MSLRSLSSVSSSDPPASPRAFVRLSERRGKCLGTRLRFDSRRVHNPGRALKEGGSGFDAIEVRRRACLSQRTRELLADLSSRSIFVVLSVVEYAGMGGLERVEAVVSKSTASSCVAS
jgi:hypothetical protein